MSVRGGQRIRSQIRMALKGMSKGRRQRIAAPAGLVMASLVLYGCQETQTFGPIVHPQATAQPQRIATPSGENARAPEVANPPVPLQTETSETVPGTGNFINTAPSAAGAAAAQAPAGDITLNFVNTDVREVLPRVLGDVLHLNYTIDPKVQATITVQTSRPLRQQDVLPVLQQVLRASGLTLVASDGIYRLVPSEDAARSGAIPVTIGQGAAAGATARPYNIQILPLKFVAASELQRTLEPFLPKGAIMQADTTRNLLILSGTGIDLSTVTDMVKAFDVDWISGMSYAIIPVPTAAPKAIVDQLTTIFGPKGTVPLPGMLSFAPLERMNAVLVVSPQRAYVEQARMWIERLERGENDNRPRLFEYHVQNSRAVDLAKVLTGLFSSGQVSTVQPQTAPGTYATQIGSGNQSSSSMTGSSPLTQGSGLGSALPGSQSAAGGGAGSTSGLGSTLLQAPAAQPNAAAADQSAGASAQGAAGDSSNAAPNPALPLPPVRIVADEKNNNIVIFARSRDYRMIAETLAKLDVVPLQVLIEATIAEVTLGNDLQYGLQYFFHAHENQFIFGSTTTPITAGTAINGIFPGFNYILGSTNANVVLNLLSSITNVHVVSSPELLVLDHQTASLLVGNQVPIPTAQVQSTVTTGAPIVNTIQYVDTGVILKVSPRVNASGLITLDVGQEVSSVANANTTAATNSLGPTISQRRIQSTITVQDGETVALGGLIQDNTSLTKTGLPGLSDVPVLGALFRSTDRNVQRTELLVLLSPRVLHNAGDARAATDELRSRLRALDRTDTQIP